MIVLLIDLRFDVMFAFSLFSSSQGTVSSLAVEKSVAEHVLCLARYKHETNNLLGMYMYSQVYNILVVEITVCIDVA